MLFGGAADVDVVPRRAFEQDVDRALAARGDFSLWHFASFGFDACRVQHFFGGIVYLGFRTAHHARQGQRSFFVADKHIHGSEFALHSIKRDKFFTVLCGAGADLDFLCRVGNPTYKNVIIKGVQRLAKFDHGVIGRIHDVVDGAHAREFQSALDLVRAGFDFHVADQSHHKARIEFRVGNFDFDKVGHRLNV